MVVELSKVTSTPAAAGNRSVAGSADFDGVRVLVTGRVFDGYCTNAEWQELLAAAETAYGVDRAMATSIVQIELERMGVANEAALLSEMEDLLHQFTGKDKKLDAKERNDLVQLFCKPKRGFSKGVAIDVAQHCIVNFCRRHRVKVKVGLLKWAIP